MFFIIFGTLSIHPPEKIFFQKHKKYDRFQNPAPGHRSSLVMIMWISPQKVREIGEIRDFQTSRTLRLLGVRQSSWALRNRTPRDLSIAAVFSLS